MRIHVCIIRVLPEGVVHISIGTSRTQSLLLTAFLVPHVSTSYDKLGFA